VNKFSFPPPGSLRLTHGFFRVHPVQVFKDVFYPCQFAKGLCFFLLFATPLSRKGASLWLGSLLPTRFKVTFHLPFPSLLSKWGGRALLDTLFPKAIQSFLLFFVVITSRASCSTPLIFPLPSVAKLITLPLSNFVYTLFAFEPFWKGFQLHDPFLRVWLLPHPCTLPQPLDSSPPFPSCNPIGRGQEPFFCFFLFRRKFDYFSPLKTKIPPHQRRSFIQL